MKIRYTLFAIVALLFIAMLYDNLMAFKNGIVGLTKKNGESIGCVCHGLEPDTSVSVIVSGPSVVAPNDTATFVLSIANGPAGVGGCDIATSLGSVIVSPLDTTLKREEVFPGAGFELTHKEPKPFTGDTLKFIFRYIAPSSPGIDTIFANGNSANNDTTSDGDLWNFSENFLISVNPVGISGNQSAVPGEFTLNQNFPNPFNPSTRISFTISKPSDVSLKIYDAGGRFITALIDNEYRQRGDYTVDFNAGASGLASGVYYYSLFADGKSETRKMLLVK